MAFFSVVIPVFNRAWCVERSLNSAHAFLSAVGGGEIVVVDDGSTDNSVAVVERFRNLDRGILVTTRLVRHVQNRGVCAAKNAGAAAATGEWLLFLDSDDELLAPAASQVLEALANHYNHPIHFFRCVDEFGLKVDTRCDTAVLRDLDQFITRGTEGESLPVIAREPFLSFRYDEDINGFEGLCYARMVRRLGPATLHPIIARRYYTAHDGRLSSHAGVKRRARSLALGYSRLILEHHKVLGYRAVAYLLVRYTYHRLRGLFC